MYIHFSLLKKRFYLFIYCRFDSLRMENRYIPTRKRKGGLPCAPKTVHITLGIVERKFYKYELSAQSFSFCIAAFCLKQVT